MLLGRQNGSDDKSIRTYKDAAIYMTQLFESGLFKLGGYQYGEHDYQYEVTLSSKEPHMRDFKLELDNLLIAAKTLRPELLRQALIDLYNKYDVPLKK